MKRRNEMKKITALFFVFFLIVLSGNLTAQERKKGEISFGGFFSPEGYRSLFGGASSVGYTNKFIGVEVNGGYIAGLVVLGGNLVVGAFDSKILVPFTTGGIWTSQFGGFGFNVGGGLKLMLSEAFAFRVEYRRYFFGDGDWGINVMIGGVSMFF